MQLHELKRLKQDPSAMRSRLQGGLGRSIVWGLAAIKTGTRRFYKCYELFCFIDASICLMEASIFSVTSFGKRLNSYCTVRFSSLVLRRA